MQCKVRDVFSLTVRLDSGWMVTFLGASVFFHKCDKMSKIHIMPFNSEQMSYCARVQMKWYMQS